MSAIVEGAAGALAIQGFKYLAGGAFRVWGPAWIANSTIDSVGRTAANLFSNRYLSRASEVTARTFIGVPLGIINAESASAQLGIQLASAAASYGVEKAVKMAIEYFSKRPAAPEQVAQAPAEQTMPAALEQAISNEAS
ncbi:MAG: hypothetical protein WB791_10330 [Waddliaceae bacterium]